MHYPLYNPRPARRPAARVTNRLLSALALAVVMACAAPAHADSVYTQRPDDARAIFLTKENFPVHADGVTDDSEAIQQAITRARGSIVFIPEGKYAITKPVYVPNGVRLTGYGAHRPTFVLPPNTPGYQDGDRKYMFWYVDTLPQANGPISDASEFSFGSAMSNVDFDLKDGNPAAVAVRFHTAQHSFLSHIDFHVGTAKAGLEDIGNQASDLHFYGGQYGILTKKTSPAWQFLLMDSTFEGQTVAGVNTREVGFTMIRCSFAHMPIAIEVPPGQVEQLYTRDVRMEDIKTAGIKFGDAKNFRHEITMENTACTDVPHFAVGGEAIEAPGKFYIVDHLQAGLEIGNDGREAGITSHHKEHALQAAAPVVPSDIPAIPPMDQWFTVKEGTDLQVAVNEHKVLYFPMGSYRATGTLQLKPDSVLIGLHCTRTSIGAIEASKGSSPFVMGVQCSSVHWMGSEKSAMDDIAFGGGGGGFGPGGAPGGRGGRGAPPASAPATGPAAPGGPGAMGPLLDQTLIPVAAPRGGAGPGARGPGGAGGEGAYLLINDGGGGLFRNLWVESGIGGTRLENTSTPGKIYQLSNEHHNRVEVILRNVQNWEFHDLQTEEESGQQSTYSVDIEGCQNVLFANTYMYRVSRTINPLLYAVKLRNSENVTFDNVHVFSQTRLAADNPVIDETSGVTVRSRDFTHLTVGKSLQKPAPLPVPPVFASGAKLEQLATGYTAANTLTADDQGRVYFADPVSGQIYRWNDTTKKADTLATINGGGNQPQVMGFVKPATLLVAAFAPGARQVGAIGTIDINTGEAKAVTEDAAAKPGTSLLLPVGLHNSMDVMQDYINHRGYVYRQGSNTAIISVVENEHRGYFYVPNTNIALMAGGTGRPLMQASQLAVMAPGDSHYITSEDDARTSMVTLDTNYHITTKPFVDRGGTSVVTDSAGNVYLASNQVYVFDKTGKQLGILETPERPTSLVLAGPDRKTLYITCRTSLYAIRTNLAGE